MPSFVHAAYFWFSLIFLLARTLAVSLYSSSIHEESKRPIAVFRAVPMGAWSFEVYTLFILTTRNYFMRYVLIG